MNSCGVRSLCAFYIYSTRQNVQMELMLTTDCKKNKHLQYMCSMYQTAANMFLTTAPLILWCHDPKPSCVTASMSAFS